MSCPFGTGVRGIAAPRPWRPDAPVVRVEAPLGGPVWIVTHEALAREVLLDPRIVKDTGLAPEAWGTPAPGLEVPAAWQPSLTSLDGAAHAQLRQAHAPLFTGRRMRAQAPRIAELARTELTELGPGPVDLTATFTARFPLVVLCDLLGVPSDRVDDAVAGCRQMLEGDIGGMTVLMGLGATAVATGGGLAAELRDRMPPGLTAQDLEYQLFALLFAGQLTTDVALGFVVAHALGGALSAAPPDELVREALRRHPPAPFSLWRFTATEVELGGERLPARSPVLVDIAGVNDAGHDLSFGAGPHFCAGAQLAQVELATVVEVLRTDFPQARLTVPFTELEQHDGGFSGSRLTALPVQLR
jgi:cytochrome P450